MKEAMQNVVLCFSGRIASGKSAVSRAVADQLGIQRVSFGDYVRTVAHYMGLDEDDRQVLQDIGKLYAEHPREFCGKLLERVGYTSGQALVIDGIRHERIADELRVQVAPAELILIYVEADETTIESRLSAGNSNERNIHRLENDSTEAEVLTTLPLLADHKVKTDDGRTTEDVAQEIVSWIRQRSFTARAAHSDEKIVVSKFEYERLKEEIQQMSLLMLDSWLKEPVTRRGLQLCADFAIQRLHEDLSLRVPRAPGLRKNGFAAWLNQWREKLGIAIQEEFSRQFPGIFRALPQDNIRNTVEELVWPQVESELLQFAIEGLARAWARRRVSDTATIGRPALRGDQWVIPLGIQGQEGDLGNIVLDRDGTIVEGASSSRGDILAKING